MSIDIFFHTVKHVYYNCIVFILTMKPVQLVNPQGLKEAFGVKSTALQIIRRPVCEQDNFQRIKQIFKIWKLTRILSGDRNEKEARAIETIRKELELELEQEHDVKEVGKSAESRTRLRTDKSAV